MTLISHDCDCARADIFALIGVLVFQPEHVTKGVSSNPNGPCASLLACFVSYSFSGLMQVGVSNWFQEPSFPEVFSDIWTTDTGRTMFEVAFMLLTSCVVIAIITGIICDTFGELRLRQDDAALFLSTTCFVTGIP